ncbi:hypothetical protein [Massilia alkalitolerans]|uniref:hypothetical protein n=1 Tax=Massilia alkalitolerans TaxID=286638 RepID=UPI00040498B8|nr:hypothetical protein [Massilia alkalitolerans]
MTDIQHKPAPGRKPGIEERIAAAGQRIAALQRRLDEALAELAHTRGRAAAGLAQAERYGHEQPASAPAHGTPEDSIHGVHRA